MRRFVPAIFVFAVTATFTLSPAGARTVLTSESGCWLSSNGTDYHWGDCLSELRKAVGHPHATSSFASDRGPRTESEAGCWLNTHGAHYRRGDCLGR